jgi:hypothetical protein
MVKIYRVKFSPWVAFGLAIQALICMPISPSIKQDYALVFKSKLAPLSRRLLYLFVILVYNLIWLTSIAVFPLSLSVITWYYCRQYKQEFGESKDLETFYVRYK